MAARRGSRRSGGRRPAGRSSDRRPHGHRPPGDSPRVRRHQAPGGDLHAHGPQPVPPVLPRHGPGPRFPDRGVDRRRHRRELGPARAAVVLAAVPAFVWTEERSGSQVIRRRLGHRVASNWRGPGSQQETASDSPSYPRSARSEGTRSGTRPCRAHCTSLRPVEQARLADGSATVAVVPHGVWSVGDSWYADVAFDRPARAACSRSSPSPATNLKRLRARAVGDGPHRTLSPCCLTAR